MARYRITNYKNEGYIVQDRSWRDVPFTWNTHREPYYWCYRIFGTIEEAKKYLKEYIEKEKKYKEEVKKMKYTEYL